MTWKALICPAVLVLSACSESSDPDPTPRRPLKAVLQYEAILSGARPYPNQRFHENRKALQAALLEQLQ
ncbi:hypothetical protein [Corallococcus sp. RDP092CA]|uniref:hypothetical protein n=1 Tax=Corallococcus sp. RDP092CA TaxID=3109369 RepID=UPI0035B1EDFF